MSDQFKGQMNIMGGVDIASPKMKKSAPRPKVEKDAALLPENLGKAIKLPLRISLTAIFMLRVILVMLFFLPANLTFNFIG